jgi:hypothetical protein
LTSLTYCLVFIEPPAKAEKHFQQAFFRTSGSRGAVSTDNASLYEQRMLLSCLQ